MKILVAMMEHETNTFSPIPTRLQDFGPGGPLLGKAAYDAYRPSGYSIAGLLQVAEASGAAVETIIAANAAPGAAVEDEAFEFIAETICGAVANGCDALLLDLHGAMVTQSYDSGEDELMRRLRQLAPDLPIGVAFDFHGNMTGRTVKSCTTLVGYKTYPHIDMVETGRRAGSLLLDTMAGRIKPTLAYRRTPILGNMLLMATAQTPMQDLMASAKKAEAEGALAVSVFSGFPLADAPHAGLSVIAMTDNDRAGAEAICARISDQAWSLREQTYKPFEPLVQSIARAKAMTEFPVLLVDHADNCNSGGSQDTMTVIAEALRQGLTGIAAGPILDPEAVATLVEAGVGATVTLPVGGKIKASSVRMDSAPLELTGRIRTISDGRFVVRGPVFTGSQIALGRTVAFDTGAMELIVCEGRVEPLDLAMFRFVGIEPTEKRYVVVKSKMQYRPTFGAMAKHIVECNGSGAASMDLTRFDFRKVERPVYPLDRM